MSLADTRNRDWPMIRALASAAEEMVEFLKTGPTPYTVMIPNRQPYMVPDMDAWLKDNIGGCMIERLPRTRPMLEGEPRADYEWTDGNWIGVAWPTLTPEGRLYLFTNPDHAFAFKMR